MLATVSEGKVNIVVALSDELVNNGMNAANIIKSISSKIEGGGGGQPHLATAGGKNPGGIQAAFDEARKLLK